MSKQAPFGQPAVYSATPPTLSDGDGAGLQVDSSGNLKISGEITGGDIEVGAVEIKNSTDDTRATVGANGLQVDVRNIAAAQTIATVTNLATIGTSVTPGTTATNLGKAEDAAHTSSDVGVMALAVRESTPTDLSAGNTNGDYEPLQVDANGALWVTQATLLAGEDLTVGVMKVEQRFSFLNVTGDTAVKSGAGFLHSVTFAQTDAAPTAGSIILYDNTAESGTIIQTVNFTTAVFQPYTLIYDLSFATGLYVGFTTTADVNVTVSYR